MKQKVNHSLQEMSVSLRRAGKWCRGLCWGWVGIPSLVASRGEVTAVLALDCDVLVALEEGGEGCKRYALAGPCLGMMGPQSSSARGVRHTVCAACEDESHGS